MGELSQISHQSQREKWPANHCSIASFFDFLVCGRVRDASTRVYRKFSMRQNLQKLLISSKCKNWNGSRTKILELLAVYLKQGENKTSRKCFKPVRYLGDLTFSENTHHERDTDLRDQVLLGLYNSKLQQKVYGDAAYRRFFAVQKKFQLFQKNAQETEPRQKKVIWGEMSTLCQRTQTVVMWSGLPSIVFSNKWGISSLLSWLPWVQWATNSTNWITLWQSKVRPISRWWNIWKTAWYKGSIRWALIWINCQTNISSYRSIIGRPHNISRSHWQSAVWRWWAVSAISVAVSPASPTATLLLQPKQSHGLRRLQKSHSLQGRKFQWSGKRPFRAWMSKNS